MSIEPNGAYDEAEKGTVDIMSSTPPLYSTDEKQLDRPIEAAPPQFFGAKHKALVAEPKKPAQKPKKVSKWVRWRLWFNTYRYNLCFKALALMLKVNTQEILLLHIWSQYDRAWFGSLRTFSLCYKAVGHHGGW